MVSCSWLAGNLPSVLQAADRIVLRNFEILTDKTVTEFDEDGIRLDDGSTPDLGRDRESQGRVAASRL